MGLDWSSGRLPPITADLHLQSFKIWAKQNLPPIGSDICNWKCLAYPALSSTADRAAKVTRYLGALSCCPRVPAADAREVCMCSECRGRDRPSSADSCPETGKFCFFSETTFEIPWEQLALSLLRGLCCWWQTTETVFSTRAWKPSWKSRGRQPTANLVDLLQEVVRYSCSSLLLLHRGVLYIHIWAGRGKSTGQNQVGGGDHMGMCGPTCVVFWGSLLPAVLEWLWLHLFGQILVTWSHLAAKKPWRCSFFWLPRCTSITLKFYYYGRKREEIMGLGHWWQSRGKYHRQIFCSLSAGQRVANR